MLKVSKSGSTGRGLTNLESWNATSFHRAREHLFLMVATWNRYYFEGAICSPLSEARHAAQVGRENSVKMFTIVVRYTGASRNQTGQTLLVTMASPPHLWTKVMFSNRPEAPAPVKTKLWWVLLLNRPAGLFSNHSSLSRRFQAFPITG
jgi:hypothetical protein